MSKVEEQIKKALDNINEDRRITRELLDDAIKYVAIDEARHKEIGIVMSKYVETLQRSNEQLVKIVAMLNKDTPQESRTLSKEEKESLYNDLEEQK